MSLILGIETSCDETAVAVVRNGEEVLSNTVASQIAKHAPHGGVVPELAAREHLKAISFVCARALEDAQSTLSDIAAVAVTNLPGLMPALLVGLSFAKGLSRARKLPLIGVNHFFGHCYAPFLDNKSFELKNHDNYPLLALIVSGGHTSLLLISADGKARIIGSTIDDAAGEALDKGAKLMNLGYPGGPEIEKYGKRGDDKLYRFPRPLTGAAGKPVASEHKYNFSFSGVKTSLLYHCRRELENKKSLDERFVCDSAAAYQDAVVDVLVRKTSLAARDFGAKSIILSGGVGCNSLLRQRFGDTFADNYRLFISEKKYCTDNAAMIAAVGYHHFIKQDFSGPNLDAKARLPQISTVPFI